MSLDLYALLLTLGAGMATPLGGALALIGKRGSNEDRLLALGMGLAGGVLLFLALQGLFLRRARSWSRSMESEGISWLSGASPVGWR